MTSALVGLWPVALAVEGAAGSGFRSVDAEDAVVLEAAGFEAGAFAAELGASPTLGAGVLPAAAGDEIVTGGPGFADSAELQPETNARTAVATQSIRCADRCRDRCDRILPFTVVFHWPSDLQQLCHRDMPAATANRGTVAETAALWHMRSVWR